MATKSYYWSLVAYEQQGNLWLKWATDSPFRAQQGQICVYSGTSFPTNPHDNRKATAWDNDPSPWNTKLPWGNDWYCAYIAQASPNGPYVYAVQLITVGKSDPESRRSD